MASRPCRKGEPVSKSMATWKPRSCDTSSRAAKFVSVWLFSTCGPYHDTTRASMPADFAWSTWRAMAARSVEV